MKRFLLILVALIATVGLIAQPWNDTRRPLYIPGLVGWWKLDNAGGPNVALDSSGFNNNGTGQGGITIGGAANQSGRAGKATSFNGVQSSSASYIQLTTATSLGGFSALTLSGWVYMTNALGGDVICKQFEALNGAAADPYQIWDLSISSTAIWFALSRGTAGTRTFLNPTVTAPINVWHHVAATWDGALMRVYLDGVANPSTASFTGPVGVGTRTPVIGAFLVSTAYSVMRGSISDARLYNRALSAAEVAALYQSTRYAHLDSWPKRFLAHLAFWRN